MKTENPYCSQSWVECENEIHISSWQERQNSYYIEKVRVNHVTIWNSSPGLAWGGSWKHFFKGKTHVRICCALLYHTATSHRWGWGSRLCCTTTWLPQDYHSIYISVSNMANNWALDRCHQSCHPCTFQKIPNGKELLVEQGQEKSQPKPAVSEPPKFLNNCLLFAI